MQTTTAIQTSLRNAELPELVALLREQADVRYDVVATSDTISMRGGNIVVKDGTTSFDESGVSTADAILRPTTVFDGGVADRLGIPVKYLRRMREAAVAEHESGWGTPGFTNVYADLLDANVNTWLQENPAKKWLVRGFLGSGATTGMARAFLSDQFSALDNLDILLAALAGAKRTGAHLDVVSADLSERGMRVKVACPEIAALAPVLLQGYRSPFDDQSPERQAMMERHGYLRPDDQPVVFAGFVIGNSETGNGRWTVTPELTVKVCSNGMTIKADRFGKTHLGGKLEEGVVNWSHETRKKNIELVTAQTTDVIETFISEDYVKAKIAEIEAMAGVQIDKPIEMIATIGKQFSFSQEEQDLILADFITGGQGTSGGVLNAITSVAQRVESPDRAAEISDMAMEVFASVAKAG